MKRNITLSLLVFAFLFKSQLGATTLPEVSMANTQDHPLTSSESHQPYRIWVKPPNSYNISTTSYPVIYMLDAQWDFTLLISLYGQLRADGMVPDAILVGITWGGEAPNYDCNRFRDFLPIEKNADGITGASQFLAFLEDDLKPYIAKNFRTNDASVLMGSSFGGWFTLYAMFEKPQLFSGYLATAPTVTLEDNILLNYAKGFDQRLQNTNAKLYMAVGDKDGHKQGFTIAKDFFDQQQFSGLTYETRIFDNTAHSSIKGNGNTRGLEYLFAQRATPVPTEQLNKWRGKYHSANDDVPVEVSVQNGQLHLSAKERFDLPMDSLDANRFFLNNYMVEAQFTELQNQKVLHLSFGHTMLVYTQ